MASSDPQSPRKTGPERSTAAAARLRAAIDRGETGDKVPYGDPAAVPLGTDDEAAGMPPPDVVAPAAVPSHPKAPAGFAKGWERPPGRALGIAAAAAIIAIVLVGLIALGVAGALRP